jgi:two-component system, cell cycle sensor histidine kinase and response regulator CckA
MVDFITLVSIACAAAGLAPFLLFLREVRRRHAVERFLVAANRRVEELEASAAEGRRMEAVVRRAAEVALDLRNVLTAILGFSTLLLEKARDPELRANALEIVKAGERAAVLSTRLLSIGRRGSASPRPLELNAFLRGLEPLLFRLVTDRVAVHLRFADEPLRVAADDAQLEQVILNLVANAVDAMPAAGTLSLRTASRTVKAGEKISGVPVPPGPYAEITIEDTGKGMDTATLARAFEPFFTTKPAGESTGLGLSTAYGIVKNSGGYLWLESAPGRGTTATIQLPREAPAN